MTRYFRITLFATLALVAAATTAPKAEAQETVASYYAVIGSQDMRNSNGVALGDIGQMIQQDRANYHRFGRRDQGDQGDPIFGNAERRSMIPGLVAAHRDNGWWSNVIAGPNRSPFDVLVIVCTRNKTLSHIIINPADGDGYVECEGRVTAGD